MKKYQQRRWRDIPKHELDGGATNDAQRAQYLQERGIKRREAEEKTKQKRRT
jgi:hypothetical protein